MLTPAEALIQKLYHSYRHTSNIDQKGLFFSPTCMQICRPIPSYAATTREEIVQYLKDAEEGNVPVENNSAASSPKPVETKEEKREAAQHNSATSTAHTLGEKTGDEDVGGSVKSRGVYTIRPLHPRELEFSSPSVTAPLGLTPSLLVENARSECWIGMRVDLWDEGPPNEEGAVDESLLVKVQYWWREEDIRSGEEINGDVDGRGWRQCLHDIMYLGPKDGTQGEEGLEVKE